MKVSSLSRKWLPTLVCAGLLAIVGAASAEAVNAHGAIPGASAPSHGVHAISSSQQTHYMPGPYIAARPAQRAALSVAGEMGAGARVVSASIVSVAAASKATGQRVASYFSGSTRDVWLVWVRGPWKILNCIQPSSCLTKPDQLYYIVIDAKTGMSYGMGWRQTYPHAP